ncbi:hypothetical protein [Streptomyces sp. Tue6028]|uniref:hypothetical protein n=1 Tax=Streptomyces sp. Tue6028 TaxID=2036037 RepID=UPI003EBF06FD
MLNSPTFVVTALGFIAPAMSAWWTTSRKRITAGWFILPNLFLHVDQAFGLSHSVAMALSFIAVAVRAGVLVWLWRHRVAPGRINFCLPRWAHILPWSLLVAFILFELFFWISAFTVCTVLFGDRGSP